MEYDGVISKTKKFNAVKLSKWYLYRCKFNRYSRKNQIKKKIKLQVFVLILNLCECTSEIHGSKTKVRRSIVDPYGPPPFAPFGAVPSFAGIPPFGIPPPFGGFFPPFPPSFPPPPFPGVFPSPLGSTLSLPPPPILPSPFPSPFPLPFYPPGPPFAYPFPAPPYPYPPPPPAPVPPPLPPPPPPPAPAPIILPAHTAATLSVASLLHALIAKKFYPPVVPFPIPRPVPFPVTVKVPVPVPYEQPHHITVLKAANHANEPVIHEDPQHEEKSEWNSSLPNEWHSSSSNEWHPSPSDD
ncbi:uncharacterized protein ACRADG_008951 [Cochliomyia hominivorax]